MSDAAIVSPSLFKHHRGWTKPRSLADTLRPALLFAIVISACLTRLATGAELSVIAKTGTQINGQTIANIRPGVSINDRGTIAFAASTSTGRGALLAMTPDGQLIEPRSTGTLVSGYGVQVNDSDDIAFLVGPGISVGFDYCVPPEPPAIGCMATLGEAEVVYSLVAINAINPTAATRTLAYSYVRDAQNTIVDPRNGPWTSLGPAFSFNNAGQIAFLGDISVNRQVTSYALGTFTPPSTFPTPRSVDVLSRPMLADNGRVTYKAAATEDSPVLVTDYGLSSTTTIASTSDGFAWLGLYPGITDSGQRVAFTGRFTGNTNILPVGDGLFLSTFANGQWTNRLVLGTNHWGTNIFSRFHSYYRTCVAELSTRPNSVKICFGAATPAGRVGLYAVTYDTVKHAVLSIETLVESGRDVVGLGNPSSFEMFDAINDRGEIVFWVQTAQGDAVIEAKREIVIIDPFPELIDNNGIITVLASLAAATNKVQGLVADGTTRVLLRLETPGDGLATFSLTDDLGNFTGSGTLSTVGASLEQSGVTNRSEFLNGKWLAFALLRAPTNFARPSENDELFTSRRLQLSVRFIPDGDSISEEIARQRLRLHRPPVVLMHGIWSDSHTWKWPLLRDSRFHVYAHNYQDTAADSFEINRFQPLAAITVALRQVRSKRVAAVQVDYLGHSMGGILARRHVAPEDSEALRPELKYRRAENYFLGDIHKLITLNTPHLGSELADRLLYSDDTMTPLGWAVDEVVDEVWGVLRGAVGDLRTDRNPINGLRHALVPAHAIVGVGGPAAQTQVVGLGLWLHPYVQVLIAAPVFYPSFGLGLTSHDLIVKEASQRGGLESPFTSTFEFADALGGDWAVHFTVTGESRISDRVVTLLNTTVEGGLFDFNGFPANPHAPDNPEPSPRFTPAALPPAFVQGLRFTSPVPGLSVAPGSDVVVTLTANDDYQPAKVLIVGPFGADLDEAAPFALNLSVPTNWLGPLAVKAFGVDANGVFAESPELVLNVATTATLTNLTLRPETVYLFDYAQTKQVEVFGQFSDGVERKLAASDQRIITVDSTVATVTTNGVVEARRLGQTMLGVRNGPLAASAPIVVLGTPFTNAPPVLAQHLEVIDLGPNVTQLTDINNAGQVLCHIGNRPAIWQNGTITPLLRPPDANDPAANALSESGVVSGGNGLAILWLSPTNFVYVTNPDGSIFGGANGAGVSGIHDSDTGLIGRAVLHGGPGIGRPPPGAYFRLSGTQVVIPPIVPQGGLPAGYEWTTGDRLNRNGVLIGHVDRYEGEAILSARPATIDTSNQVTVLEGWEGIGAARAINDAGDVVGVLPGGSAALWRGGKLTVLWTGDGGEATAVNSRGHVAIYRSANSTPSGGAIWANGNITTLQELVGPTPDWASFEKIVAMNDSGWVVCTAGHQQQGERRVLIKLGPAVRTQPISRTKVPGQSVSYSALAYGVGDLTYQWRHHGTNLSESARFAGANTSQLTVNQIELGDAGAYDLVVNDAYGTTTSSNAMLTVLAEGCVAGTNGLIAHWNGDGHAQEVLNRYTATLMNGAGFSNGLVNSAFVFDGVNDFVATDLDIQTSIMPTMTWEAWVFPTHLSHSNFQFIMGDTDRDGYRALAIAPGTDEFRVQGGGCFPGCGTLAKASSNQWQHIVVVFFPDRVEFYKNGERYDLGGGPTVIARPSMFSIGCLPEARSGRTVGHFEGLIDEVTVYNRALSQTEIKATYDVGYAGKCRPPMAPMIVTQPPDLTAYTGADVTIPIGTHGAAPVSYWWYREVTNLVANTTEGRLVLKNVQPSQAGGYAAVVSNAFGVVTSAIANLVVRSSCESQWKVTDRQTPATGDSMAFDSAQRVILTVDGNGVTRYWSGASWGVAAQGGPRGKVSYDSGRNVTVLFGASGQTFEWDWNSWQLASSSGPTGRTEHAMIYDAARSRTVLFGGVVSSGQALGDTWEWDGIEWQQVAGLGVGVGPNCVSPVARRGPQIVYDSNRQRIVLFGGVDPVLGQVLGDTWEWDGLCWHQMHPVESPPPRFGFGMVYHAERESVIVVGGNGNGYLTDAWELLGSSWVRLPVEPGGDPGRYQYYGGGIGYDSFRRVILDTRLDETWVWGDPDAPVLQQQPATQARFLGESVSLSACATGRGVLSYQWFVNGTNFVGSGPSLAFGQVRPGDAGSYSVVVSNTFGSVTSSVARLAVLPCQSAPTGAVAWWRAEGDATDNASTNHGALVDGASFQLGKVDQAFRFDGVDDYVRVKASSNLNVRTARGLTIEGWIQPGDLLPRPLVEWNRGTNENASVGVHLWISGPTNEAGTGALYLNLRDTSRGNHTAFSAPGVFVANELQHIGVTYDRPLGIVTLYRNGVLLNQQSIGSLSLDTAPDVYLGHRPGTTNVFAGLMDEISVYNRALASNEISSIYSAGAAGKCLKPDGTPYIYFDGVNYEQDVLTFLDDAPPHVSMLSTFTDGAIRYTVGGAVPSGGQLYAAPFLMSSSAAVRAVATNSVGTVSQEVFVDVNIVAGSGLPLHQLRVVSATSTRVWLVMRGLPGARYALERSTNLASWSRVTTASARSDGVIDFKDLSPPLGGGFYRALAAESGAP